MRGRVLELECEHPTVLHVARTHALTVVRGWICDSEEPRPLPLTRENPLPHKDESYPSGLTVLLGKIAEFPAREA